MSYTDAQNWKKKDDAVLHDLLLPSGNTCLVRRPGVQAFITGGMVPNSLLSMLTPVFEEAEKAGKEGRELDTKLEDSTRAELLNDPTRLTDVLTLVDSVTLYCVVKPTVLEVPVWTNEDDVEPELIGKPALAKKDPEKLYVDEVDLEDKMFIFQYAVGGTKDLEPFREATSGNVEVGSGQ